MLLWAQEQTQPRRTAVCKHLGVNAQKRPSSNRQWQLLHQYPSPAGDGHGSGGVRSQLLEFSCSIEPHCPQPARYCPLLPVLLPRSFILTAWNTSRVNYSCGRLKSQSLLWGNPDPDKSQHSFAHLLSIRDNAKLYTDCLTCPHSTPEVCAVKLICRLVSKSCLTLCNPMEFNSPSGSSGHRIFPRRGLPFPSPGDLPDSGIEPRCPALAGKFFSTKPTQGSPILIYPNEETGAHKG